MQTGQPEKIRVLIADDSLFIRTYLTSLLRADSEIEVVGAASSGVEVVTLTSALHPDVITMDYHMPGKNGLEATEAIMLGVRPFPAVIMLSAFAEEGGEKIRSILEASGANVILKPSGEVSLDMEKVAVEIVKKIKEVGRKQQVLRNAYLRVHHETKNPEEFITNRSKHGIVVIGASTGGPPLVERLLTRLDSERGLSIVIAQHMSGYFTELFAERLNRVTNFSVREAKNGDTLEPGVALVIPGGHMLAPYPRDVGAVAFNVEPIPTELHEAMIDMTMRTLAGSCGARVVGVLLSGMGHDGAVGLRAISSNGGLSLVQDPSTSTVSSMPNNALRDAGPVEMLETENMPDRIYRYFS